MKWARENHDLLEALAWLILGVPTLLWWRDSVLWVAVMSIYANSKTAVGAWKAERAHRAAKSRVDVST